jgi:hypothetical protein
VLASIAEAVNIEIRMPMLMVMAKPRIAPVPIANRISIFMSVVALASTMVRWARRKPASSAEMTPPVLRASSRARSLIRMLASTAMPSASIVLVWLLISQ